MASWSSMIKIAGSGSTQKCHGSEQHWLDVWVPIIMNRHLFIWSRYRKGTLQILGLWQSWEMSLGNYQVIQILEPIASHLPNILRPRLKSADISRRTFLTCYKVPQTRHKLNKIVDVAEWLERLIVNAIVATFLGSIPASSDIVESEGRQVKQCWITYIKIEKMRKNTPLNKK